MLLAAKVQKKGTALLVALINGIIYFAIGECTWTIILSFAIAGIVAEIARAALGYQTIKSALISCGILAAGFIGSPLPMWLIGMDPTYVANMQKMISVGPLFGFIAVAFLSDRDIIVFLVQEVCSRILRLADGKIIEVK